MKEQIFPLIIAIFFAMEVRSLGGFKNFFDINNSWKTALILGLINSLFIASFFSGFIQASISSNQEYLIQNPYLELIFITLALDLWTYIWHRLNHRVPILWRFHRVHHMDQSLHSLSAFRFHFGEVALSYILRFAIFLVLPLRWENYVIFELIYGFSNVFAHSRIHLNYNFEKNLEKLLVSPRFHRLHHHPTRKIHDSNYGTIFSFWDKIFKSHTKISKKDSFEFGLQEQRKLSITETLLSPFRSMNK